MCVAGARRFSWPISNQMQRVRFFSFYPCHTVSDRRYARLRERARKITNLGLNRFVPFPVLSSIAVIP